MKRLLALFAFVSLVSCKQWTAVESAETEAVKADVHWNKPGRVETGPATTYVYHWTYNQRAKSDPLKYLQDEVANASLRNAKIESVSSGEAMAGFGIYAASDPFVAKDYGNILLQIPVLANAQGIENAERVDQGSEKPQVKFALIKSAAPAIVYEWLGAFNRAVVIRSLSVVDVSAIQVFACDECYPYNRDDVPRKSPLPSFPILTGPLKSKSVMDAVKELGGNLSAMDFLSSEDSLVLKKTEPSALSDRELLRLFPKKGSTSKFLTPDRNIAKLVACKDNLTWEKEYISQSDSCAKSLVSALAFAAESTWNTPEENMRSLPGGFDEAVKASRALGVIAKDGPLPLDLKTYFDAVVTKLKPEALEIAAQGNLRKDAANVVIDLAHQNGMSQWKLAP